MTDDQIYSSLRCCAEIEDDEKGVLSCEHCPFYNKCTSPAFKVRLWLDYVEKLRGENAVLRERLEKAVELPRVECIITKEWVNREMVGDRMFEWCVLYKKDGYLMVEPCLSKEAAEARLKELPGGKE